MLEKLQNKYPTLIINNTDSKLSKTFFCLFHALTTEVEYEAVSDSHGSRKFGSDLYDYGLNRLDIAQYLFSRLGLLST